MRRVRADSPMAFRARRVSKNIAGQSAIARSSQFVRGNRRSKHDAKHNEDGCPCVQRAMPQGFGSDTQRKELPTPAPNEANHVGTRKIVPPVRGLNKERGCAAVSIGEKCHRSDRRSPPKNDPTESGLCVNSMLAEATLRLGTLI